MNVRIQSMKGSCHTRFRNSLWRCIILCRKIVVRLLVVLRQTLQLSGKPTRSHLVAKPETIHLQLRGSTTWNGGRRFRGHNNTGRGLRVIMKIVEFYVEERCSCCCVAEMHGGWNREIDETRFFGEMDPLTWIHVEMCRVAVVCRHVVGCSLLTHEHQPVHYKHSNSKAIFLYR